MLLTASELELFGADFIVLQVHLHIFRVGSLAFHDVTVLLEHAARLNLIGLDKQLSAVVGSQGVVQWRVDPRLVLLGPDEATVEHARSRGDAIVAPRVLNLKLFSVAVVDFMCHLLADFLFFKKRLAKVLL